MAFAGVFYPVEAASEVLNGYRANFADAPDEVTAEALSITMPADPSLPEEVHDRECLVVGGVYAGDHAEGMHVLRPLRELATPLADISQPMPFAAVQSAFDGFFPRGQVRAYWKATYVASLDDEVIEIVARASAERPSRSRSSTRTQWEAPSPGSERRRPPSRRVCSVHGHGAGELGRRRRRRCEHRLGSWRLAGGRRSRRRVTYLNFSGADDAEPARAAVGFGSNLERLARIKAQYDPENVFHRNNNIVPSGG